MQKIKYKLIVSDLDGTLLDKNKNISEKTLLAIKRYVENGGRFVLSTGRMLPSTLRYAKQLGLKGLISCFQGGLILDLKTGETVFDQGISNADAIRISEVLERLEVYFQIFYDGKFFANFTGEWFAYYAKHEPNKGMVVAPKTLSQFLRETGYTTSKILLSVDPSEQQRFFSLLSDEFGKEFYVTTSSSKFIELCNKSHSKGTALEFIADYYGIPLSETIAIGDQNNDIPMIERAGLGFAMQNATDGLKNHPKAVVLDDTNDQDGVANMIEKYAYEKVCK